MKIQSIKQIKNLENKCVLLRVDFNVPIKNNQIQEDERILLSLPTIQYLLEKKAKIILLTHLGRPLGYNGKGKGGYNKKFQLKPIVGKLEELIGQNIKLVSDFKLPINKYFVWAQREVAKMQGGDILILENIRFFPDEAKNTKELSKSLAELADVFVLDGFAISHRDAASVSGVAKLLPSYAGFSLEKELTGLDKVMSKPKKPLVVVLGGVKMETKIPVLKNLIKKADYILLGGGLSSTYFLAKGCKVGSSLVDKAYKNEALFYGKKKKVILPIDVVVGKSNGKEARVIGIDKNFSIKNPALGIFDIGPKTTKLFSQYIKKAHTIIWNGAMGYFEQSPYQHGTYAIAHLIAARSTGKVFGVAGGGETIEILRRLKVDKQIDLISTGGGAMLEYLSGKKLPGVEAVIK